MNALILKGFGLHCFQEAYNQVKKSHDKTYIYDLRFPDLNLLNETGFVLIPGGFSFGDELGAGFMFAKYLKLNHKELYEKIIHPKVLVLGICNGFQILSHTECFDDLKLLDNTQERFIYQWTNVNVTQNSFWFEGMKRMQVCVRHGEGRLLSSKSPCLTYDFPINGGLAAGMLSDNQMKLGLMPHPEIILDQKNSLIENGVNYAKNSYY